MRLRLPLVAGLLLFVACARSPASVDRESSTGETSGLAATSTESSSSESISTGAPASPVAREGDLVRFEVLDRPGFLQADILPGEGTFEMAVFVRGEAHGTFDLAHPG